MLCSNRTSSCDFLAERPSRAGRLSEFRFFGENSRGDFAGVDPSASTIAAPSAFCDTVPDGETSGTRSSNRSPCAKISVIMPPPCAQAPVKALVPGLLPPYSRQRYSPRTLVARGRCLDIDYCTISPCSARSRPSRSMSCVTRRPTTFLTTKRMIKLATAS